MSKNKSKQQSLKKRWRLLILLLLCISVATTGKILSDKEIDTIANCNNEIMGFIEGIDHRNKRGDYFHYVFMIENKRYKGTESTIGLRNKMNIGDSIIIEYACDNLNYHRIKPIDD
ncbi:hypothetical protein [Mangrovimonas sp. TPBH4]|uniref:hypothetical protein n=1 Tax=Mangrovimonas sp. TPBH4 TaxID=1645914 RepID=UPI000B14C8A8|nr:hypothetical protein [Mangrovimonas sp. TPBH4]